jgi:hypothetical protein
MDGGAVITDGLPDRGMSGEAIGSRMTLLQQSAEHS